MRGTCPARHQHGRPGARSLNLNGTNMNCWRSVDTVWYLASASTLTGSRKHARCSLATLLVMVAENSCVLRSCTRGQAGPRGCGDRPAAASAAHLGDDFQDLVNLLLKVHVQQPVRLVQHQVLQRAQREALQPHTPADTRLAAIVLPMQVQLQLALVFDRWSTTRPGVPTTM